jgi:hypothetical protein
MVAVSLANGDATATKTVDVEMFEVILFGEDLRIGLGMARYDPDLALGPFADLVGCEV